MNVSSQVLLAYNAVTHGAGFWAVLTVTFSIDVRNCTANESMPRRGGR